MLDVGKLATFRMVVEQRSFSAAASSLSLTQPAVSRQVSLLERQVGTQLVLRTRRGVQPTAAGRLLVDHADAILGRLALAERELADLAGLRRGQIALGSFFTALVYLSAEVGSRLDRNYPNLVLKDELVDRRTAFRQLIAGRLDIAIVFEHEFEPEPPPEDIELVDLFRDPPRLLLPARHRLASRRTVSLEDLVDETWVRAHEGSAARLLDYVFRRYSLAPPTILAGRGDEPAEAQALVAAGKGVMLAHDLNVVISPERIVAKSVEEELPVRHIQAAIMRGQRMPATRTVLEAVRDVGRERAQRLERQRPPSRSRRG